MENIKDKIYMKIVRGLLISFIVTLILMFIFAILLTITNISENTIPIVVIALSFVSILIGSTISTRKINKNGMLNGGLIGGTYVILLYLISSILNNGFSVNIYTIIMIILGIIAGLIGGIIGINT